jgi:hypothetical protein
MGMEMEMGMGMCYGTAEYCGAGQRGDELWLLCDAMRCDAMRCERGVVKNYMTSPTYPIQFPPLLQTR